MDEDRINAARKLYADDFSVKLFEHRREYAETGQIIPLLDMVLTAIAAYQEADFVSNIRLIELIKLIYMANHAKTNKDKTTLVIWGAGNGAATPLELIYECGLIDEPDSFECLFCDNNPNLWDTERPHQNPAQRLSIVSPERIRTLAPADDCFVIIAVNTLNASQSIFEQLISMGFPEKRILRQIKLFQHSIGRIYFERDIMIPTATEEIFVDSGAFDLANTRDFIQWCGGNYSRVIAFEADSVSYQKCVRAIETYDLERVQAHHRAVFSSNGEMRFLSAPGDNYYSSKIDDSGDILVNTVCLDSFLAGDPVTIIKMDIEGAEMDALKGAEGTIKKWKPRLAISAYHKPWDIVELPLYLQSLIPGYRFYLRHHTCGPWETVLYAVQ